VAAVRAVEVASGARSAGRSGAGVGKGAAARHAIAYAATTRATVFVGGGD
jgi:hypothetical protein